MKNIVKNIVKKFREIFYKKNTLYWKAFNSFFSKEAEEAGN